MRTTFQESYDAGDTDRLLALFSDEIVLHTSAAGRPVVGKEGVQFVLNMLLGVFKDVDYVAEYASDQGMVLLCSGTVGGKRADGIQVITLDESGLIVEFRDFVRPLSALTALSEEAARFFAGDQTGGS